MTAARRKRIPRMPKLHVTIPELLILKLDQEAAFRNERDGLAHLPGAGNRKWSRSNVVCSDLGERYGIDCPTVPRKEDA